MELIVMADANWAIGKGGDQLAYIPADLKRFQALTTGHAVLLGRKTLATFPGGRPLKNRRNLILSATPGYTVEGAEVAATWEEALTLAPPDTFVIGGESVYRQFLPYCNTAHVTRLEQAFPADRYFPNLDADPLWVAAETQGPFSHDGLIYSYVTYRRVFPPN